MGYGSLSKKAKARSRLSFRIAARRSCQLGAARAVYIKVKSSRSSKKGSLLRVLQSASRSMVRLAVVSFSSMKINSSRQAAKKNSFYPFRFAAKYSLFMRAIFSREIPLGHSTSQAPVLVQFPKPSSSICLTMFNTRSVASTCP